jgi:hypothetical protein
MEDVMEVSPSGRAKCRGCKESIAKGEVRFGEVYSSAFGSEGEAVRYWHLKCAASKLGGRLKVAMARYTGDIPNKAEVEAELAEAAKKGGKGAKAPFPYAEVSPNNRARCMVCGDVTPKDELRIAVERESETPGGMVVRGAGYMHPACVASWLEESGDEDSEAFLEKVLLHSALDDAQKATLTEALGG